MLRREQGLPEDWNLLGNRGVVHLAQGRYIEALAACDQAEQLRHQQGLPVNAGLVRNRGIANSLLGQHAEALVAFDLAEKLRREQGLPIDPFITFVRAVVYAMQNDLSTACKLACQARDMYAQHNLQAPVHPAILAFIEEHCSGGCDGDAATPDAPTPDAFEQ